MCHLRKYPTGFLFEETVRGLQNFSTETKSFEGRLSSQMSFQPETSIVLWHTTARCNLQILGPNEQNQGRTRHLDFWKYFNSNFAH